MAGPVVAPDEPVLDKGHLMRPGYYGRHADSAREELPGEGNHPPAAHMAGAESGAARHTRRRIPEREQAWTEDCTNQGENLSICSM